MAEAIGAVSAVITLTATAYTSCKNLHEVIKRIRNTPRSLYVLSRDLEDFYLVLGTLQSVLDSGESTQGMLRAVTTQSLERVLQNSIGVFSDISIMVGTPIKQGNMINYPVWKRIKCTFKEKEIDNLRKNLLDHKLTLNMAISVANLFVVTGYVWSLTNQFSRHILGTTNIATESLQTDLTDICEKLPVITSRLDEARESQLPRAMVHNDVDRAAISTDYNFALRHYLGDAASSSITEVATPTTPSIQISSLGTSSGYTSSVYWTAPTQAATDTRLKTVAESCTQLLIIDLATIKTLVLHVSSEDHIKEVKDKIRHRLGLPRAQFQLTYAGSVLEESSALESCNVPHNSTLTCVSFRPNIYNEGLRYSFGSFKVVVEDLQGYFHDVEIDEKVTAEQLVPVVTLKICEKLGARPEDVRLLCNWDFHGPFDFVGLPKLKPDGTVAMRLTSKPNLANQRLQGNHLPLNSFSTETDEQ